MKKIILALLVVSVPAFAEKQYEIPAPFGEIIKETWTNFQLKGMNIPQELITSKSLSIDAINGKTLCDPQVKAEVESVTKFLASHAVIKHLESPYGQYDRAADGTMKYVASQPLDSKANTKANGIDKQCKNIYMSI